MRTPIEDITVETLEGERVTIKLKGSHLPTVIYTIKPSCVWCTRNWENLLALYSGAHGRFSLIGVSLENEGLAEYVKQLSVPFPVYKNPSVESIERLGGLGVTPQTIVVSPAGTIVHMWDGAYTGLVQAQVEQYFAVTLPGTSDLPQAIVPGQCSKEEPGTGQTSLYSAGAVEVFPDGLRQCKAGEWVAYVQSETR